MHSDSFNKPVAHAKTTLNVEVTMDRLPMEVPADRHSLVAIRSYIESAALQKQRILHRFIVDGRPMNLGRPLTHLKNFSRIEAETISPDQVPLQLIKSAMEQTDTTRAQAQSAIAQVLINDSWHAREIWWNLIPTLKEPLVTLSLLPEPACNLKRKQPSLMQLRRWQLEQLGVIIAEVDKICRDGESSDLSEALEKRVMTWLDNLQKTLCLWHGTILAGLRTSCRED